MLRVFKPIRTGSSSSSVCYFAVIKKHSECWTRNRYLRAALFASEGHVFRNTVGLLKTCSLYNKFSLKGRLKVLFGQQLVSDGLQLVDEGHFLFSVAIEGQRTVRKYMFFVQEVYLLRIWNVRGSNLGQFIGSPSCCVRSFFSLFRNMMNLNNNNNNNNNNNMPVVASFMLSISHF
jgi:hypothetical protein